MRTRAPAGVEVVYLSLGGLLLGQEREENVDGNAMLVFVAKCHLLKETNKT